MLDDEHAQLIDQAVQQSINSYYQSWVSIGIFIIILLLGILGWLAKRHYAKVEKLEENLPKEYISKPLYERDRTELKKYHDDDIEDLRREMNACQQSIRTDIHNIGKVQTTTDGKVDAVHRRIDKIYEWLSEHNMSPNGGAKS